MSIFDFFFGRKQNENNSRHGVKLNRRAVRTRNLAMEPLETRDLLSVTTGLIDDSAYAELRAQYPDFNLPEEQSELHVMTVDLDEGATELKLEDLKSAIETAGTTTQPDLILVKTSASANSVTYTSNADEIYISINASQYGSVTIIGWGEENFTLDANQQSRVMSVTGSSTIVNLGGLTITGGNSSVSASNNNYGGGIYNTYGTLTITNSEILDNEVGGNAWSGGGGGIYNNYGIMMVTNSTISGNHAPPSTGGGIYNANGTFTITNSEISRNTSGSGAVGGICNAGSNAILIVINSTISENTTRWGYGGGISNSGTLIITNSIISGNTASNSGGGIDNSGTLTITNSIISGNSSSLGSGISNSGTLTVTNSIVSQNYNENIYGTLSSNSSNNLIGYYPGFVNSPQFDSNGNLINADTMDLHLRSDSIAIDKGDNSAVADIETDIGGNTRIYGESVDIGAYEYQGDRDDEPIPYSTVVNTLNDSFDLNDDEWSLREAIYYAQEYVTITYANNLEGMTVLTLGELKIEAPLAIDGDNCITIDADQKSRVFIVSDGSEEFPVVLNGLIIQNGNVASLGGGIYNRGTLTVTNSTISGNIANIGGGISNSGSYSSLMITNSTISGNRASTSGGGIYNSGTYSTLMITNSTISGNRASTSGGGIYNSGSYSPLMITNSTISGNRASTSGGGIYNSDTNATHNLYNSIVACNTATQNESDVFTGGMITAYNCLSSYAEWDDGNDNIVYDPNLPLFIDANNGNFSLALGSQAINKGNNQYAVDADGQTLTVDLANVPRIQGESVDIGAYEFDIRQRLAVPDFTLTANGSAVTVTISEVQNASSYTVLYQIDGADGWRTIANIQGASATFVGLVNTAYNVRVQANGNESYSDSNYSSIQKVTIADDLSAQNDFVKTTLNTPAVIDYRANDEATDWSVTTVRFGEASHGEYTINEDGTIVYTPEVGFYGTDSISYAIFSPSGKMSLGSITINVELPIVPLDTPTNLALSTENTTITASWKTVDNASSYTVLYQIDGSDGWNAVIGIEGTSTSFVGIVGTKYNVKVQANGTENYSDSDYSETASITLRTPLTSLALSSIAPEVGTEIIASLIPTDATADYQWFSGETLIEGATGSSFVVTEDQIGQTITCVATGTGDYSGTVSMTTAVAPVPVTALDAPADVALSVYNATVTASWSAVENASSYTLEYKPVGAENWTALPGLEDTTASFVGVSGTMYNVRVKAVGTGDYSDSTYAEINTDKPTGPVVAINANKVTVSWVDDSPAADSVRYRVAGTTTWTTKKLKAGITSLTFNAAIGKNYDIEVLLDQQENNVLQGSAIVLDQPRLTSIRNELKDDTFQVNVTNYAAKNLAANVKQAIVSVNGVMTTLKIADQQGETALAGGGKVAFSNGLFTFSEMNSNTSYKVQISFSDGHSVSKTSSALTVKTLKAPYLPPVIVSANAVSDTSITVTWETAYGKKSTTPAQKYTVQYSTDGNKWTNATTGATGNSYTIQRLKGGVEYQVRVLATKDTAFEASAPSGVLSAQTLTLPKTTLDRTSIKDDTFKLNVTNYATSNLVNAPTLNVKSDKFGETAIAIQNGSGSATFENGMVAAFENGALTFTNVPSNTQQKIQVNFNDGVCTTALTAALTVKTTIAPYNKPVLTNATATSSTTVLVEWDAVTGKNSTVLAPSYTVQYTTDGTRWINANTRVVGTSFTIPNLKPNTPYRVAVIANKDARFNASQPSESLLVTTLN